MISKPSRAWTMLGRMLDKLMAELSNDDLDDLHQRVQTERNRRFLASRRTPGFVEDIRASLKPGGQP